jgi:hypothetical protein
VGDTRYTYGDLIRAPFVSGVFLGVVIDGPSVGRSGHR